MARDPICVGKTVERNVFSLYFCGTISRCVSTGPAKNRTWLQRAVQRTVGMLFARRRKLGGLLWAQERLPSHGRGGVEPLGDRDKRHIVCIEQLDEFCEVRQRAAQAIDLMDDDQLWGYGTARSHRGRPGRPPNIERLIGTLRRDCLDHDLIFGERHLRRVLTS